MKTGEQIIIFLAVNKNGDEVILDNLPVRQGEIWTDERSAHDEEYFPLRITIRRSCFQEVRFTS